MRGSRRSTPKVRGGKVQRKNRSELSAHYLNYDQIRPVIDRLRPGQGYRHVLRKQDVERFIELLPDWKELSLDLHAIVLAPGDENSMGWYGDGVGAVCAWDRELAGPWYTRFVDEHRQVLDRLGVRCEPMSGDTTFVQWTEASARGFSLMHILLHELGHHHDRITTYTGLRPERGESYAETYALKYADRQTVGPLLQGL